MAGGPKFKKATGGMQSFSWSYIPGGDPGDMNGVSVSPAPEPGPPDHPPASGHSIEPGQAKTFTISGLPEHREAQASAIIYFVDHDFEFSALGQTIQRGFGTQPVVHSGREVTITITNNEATGGGSIMVGGVSVTIWTPIVGAETVDGELTEDEDDGSVRLNRSGDNQLTAINTGFRPAGGTATPGKDYTIPPSATVPVGQTHSPERIVGEKDDPDAEGEESIRLRPTDGPGFVLARTGVAQLNIDDDINVQKITVEPFLGLDIAVNGFEQLFFIVMEGERVGDAWSMQTIDSTLDFFDMATGEQLGRDDALQQDFFLNQPDFDPVSVWSDGPEIDTGWDPIRTADRPTATIRQDGSRGRVVDTHRFGVPFVQALFAGGVQAVYANLAAVTRKMVFTAGKWDPATEEFVDGKFTEHSWQYRFSNFDSEWLVNDDPPRPEHIAKAAISLKGPGKIVNVQGVQNWP
ncbi:MAG: hypothetical protein AAGD32_08170 [Planctomycetota bacterium]